MNKLKDILFTGDIQSLLVMSSNDKYNTLKKTIIDENEVLLTNFINYIENNGQLNSDLRILLCKKLKINSIKLLGILIELKEKLNNKKEEKVIYNGILMNQGLCSVRLHISKIGISLKDGSHLCEHGKCNENIDIGFLDNLINRRCKVLDCLSLESKDGCLVINDLMKKIKNGTVKKIYDILKEGKKLGKLKKIKGPIVIEYIN